MTDDTTTPAADHGPHPTETENPPTETEQTEATAEDPRIAELRREAASRRTKLRAAEAERDKLAEQVTAMRRAEVERLAGDQLADAGDLWRSGVEVDQLLSDEGALDPEKVGAAVEELVKARPHYKRQPPVDFDGGARETVETPPDFAETLRKASGG